MILVPQTAVVRDLPESFAQALQQQVPSVPLDVVLARRQHHDYVAALKSILPKVVELPADESLPDCCFIEDTAVVIGNRAAITLLGAKERRGEEALVREALQRLEIQTIPITGGAIIDGGDVLFTGRHIVVGLSKRTNKEGAEQLARIFPEFPVVTATVNGSLHLKSVLSAFDQETILFGDCVAGRSILAQLSEIKSNYSVKFVPDSVASNVLNLGQSLIIQDGFSRSEKILRDLANQRNMKVITLNMSELIKADGALTCCSLLF
jgi:dimethylargininase